MRFAVQGPGFPVASPRVKGDGEVGGVPRRDVDGRVHVSVAGEFEGRAHKARLALTPLPEAWWWRHHPCWRLGGGAITQVSTWEETATVGTGVTGGTHGSGCAWGRTCMGQTCMASDVHGAGRGRSVWRNFSRAIACLTRLRRIEPRRARASLRCSRSSRVRSAPPCPGTRSSSPVDRAADIRCRRGGQGGGGGTPGASRCGARASSRPGTAGGAGARRSGPTARDATTARLRWPRGPE